MNKEKKLKSLIADLRTFATVLMAISVFIYIGIIIKGLSGSNENIWYMMVGILLLIAVAFLFLFLSKIYQKKLIDMEDHH